MPQLKWDFDYLLILIFTSVSFTNERPNHVVQPTPLRGAADEGRSVKQMINSEMSLIDEMRARMPKTWHQQYTFKIDRAGGAEFSRGKLLVGAEQIFTGIIQISYTKDGKLYLEDLPTGEAALAIGRILFLDDTDAPPAVQKLKRSWWKFGN